MPLLTSCAWHPYSSAGHCDAATRVAVHRSLQERSTFDTQSCVFSNRLPFVNKGLEHVKWDDHVFLEIRTLHAWCLPTVSKTVKNSELHRNCQVGEARAVGVGGWLPPVGIPYQVACPLIEWEHRTESSPTQVGFPPSPLFISLDTFRQVLPTQSGKKEAEKWSCLFPVLTLSNHSLNSAGTDPLPYSTVLVSFSWATVTSLSDKIQKSFAFFAGKTSSLYSIIHFTYTLFMCNVEIIVSTFLAFVADVSEPHRSLRYRCDARWRVMPFAGTSSFEGVRGMRTASLLFRVNTL